MFTVEQIELAHRKVKTGAEFPKYIQEIKQIGVIAFVTWVSDSHTEYFGKNGFQTSSPAKYKELQIAGCTDKEAFIHFLKIHQQGETDYFAFCNHCAETGIEKWFVNLDKYTCTYFDKLGEEVIVESVPSNE